MDWISRKRVGGVMLVLAGMIGNEVFGWGVEQIMTYLAARLSPSEIAAWPWGAWISLLFMLFGLGLIFWPNTKAQPKTLNLWYAADHALAQYTTAYMMSDSNKYLADANLVGESTLITFKKAGLSVPNLSSNTKIKAKQIQNYFGPLVSLLKDEHFSEARTKAKQLSLEIQCDET